MQGDPRGYHNIARAYYWGDDEQRDYLKAAEYFEKAYQIKHDTLTVLFFAKMYTYGYGYEKDTAKGIDLLLHEIGHGDTYALALLGNLLKSGDGVPADVHAGLKHIRDAAELGNLHAQDLLGDSYERGEGVKKDVSKAARWYEMAAKQGGRSALVFCVIILARLHRDCTGF